MHGVERLDHDGQRLGDWLRSRRAAALLTQEELARRAKVSVRTVQSLESGTSGMPRPATVRQLCDVLGPTPWSVAASVRAAADSAQAAGLGWSLAVPRQLPAPVGHFVGRAAPLRQLDRLARQCVGGRTGGRVAIAVIAGTGGVGKTALAVRWAHRVSHQFPDGQLYLNLRGFDPSVPPVPSTAAVRAVLEGFGVPAREIPAELDPRSSMYRTVVAGRRVLLVLDNSRDADQVRPLLPGSPTGLVVVTSRHQLTDLVAEGALPITLEPLSAEEGRLLLRRRLGVRRVAREPEAAAALVDRCARLPLALALAAARAAADPRLPLATVAADLGNPAGQLDALETGSSQRSLRVVFWCSYRELSAPAQRLFRLLGVHPGPDLTVAAARSLSGQTGDQLRRWLAELTRAHLLREHVSGRLAMHDLLRAYAAEQAGHHEHAAELAAAARRLVDHYVHTAVAADRLFQPQRKPIELPKPAAGVAPEELADHARAVEWLRQERPVLVAVVTYAARNGFDASVWQLAWALAPYLHYEADWATQAKVLRAGLAAAVQLSDADKQSWAHRCLGLAYTQLGDDDLARTHYEQALAICRWHGDRAGEGAAHLNVAWLLDRRDRPRDALRHALLALDLLEAAGHPAAKGNALNAAGWYYCRLDRPDLALDYCTRALKLHQRLRDRHGQAAAWDSLGTAHHRLGNHSEAVDCYRHAAKLSAEQGRRHEHAMTLSRLGATLHDAQDAHGARTAWEDALSILDKLGPRCQIDADALRVKLGHEPVARDS